MYIELCLFQSFKQYALTTRLSSRHQNTRGYDSDGTMVMGMVAL